MFWIGVAMWALRRVPKRKEMERTPEDGRREVAVMAAYDLLNFVRVNPDIRSGAIVMAAYNLQALVRVHFLEGKKALQEAGISLP